MIQMNAVYGFRAYPDFYPLVVTGITILPIGFAERRPASQRCRSRASKSLHR